MRERPIAFVDVNLVPMDSERVLRSQTVIVDNDRITAIGDAAKFRVPSNAHRIEAGGKYLMSGLADMHTHTWGEADLVLFLANGVTTIRNMWGSARQLAWRKRIANGLLLGPTIYTAGPLIDGKPPIWNSSKVVETREQAEEEVAREKKLGYDFVKVYNRLSLEAFQAIVAAAKKHGLPVAGHIPDAVGLEAALKAGQNSIEHLTGYISAVEADDSPVKGKPDRESRRRAIDFVDEAKIPRIIRSTIAANTWNCVTLIVTQKFVSAEVAKELLQDRRMKFVPPEWLASWDPSKDFRLKDLTQADFEKIRKADAMKAGLTLKLHKAGARILLGTDTPNPFVIPGFSIHEELQNLVGAGLSPYEAIRAGTRDAAEFLNAEDEFGTVEVGKRADLILLDANPLENVDNVSRRVGVMVRGKWYPEEELEGMLDRLVATYELGEERLAGLFQPFPVEAETLLSSRYQVKLTDTLLGEERFAVQKLRRGGFQITSQAVMNAPPRVNNFLMRVQLDENWTPTRLSFESKTSEGSSKVNMEQRQGRVTIRGNQPEGPEFQIERIESEGVLLGSSLLASYVPIIKRLYPLKVGEKASFRMLKLENEPELDFLEAALEVERKDDVERAEACGLSRSMRTYGFKDTRNNASYTGTILLDGDRLAVFEREEQMGLLHFESLASAQVWLSRN